MNLVMHIVRKDFRHLRFYLAGWLALVILRAAVIGYGPLDSSIWNFSSFNYYEILAWFPQICLLAIMIARLVQDDSLVGSTAFWLDRPITGRQLLLGKLLFLGLTVILPLFVVELLLLGFHRVTLPDVFRSIPQILAYELLLISVLLMFSAVTRKLVHVALLGLLGPIVWMLFYNFSRNLFFEHVDLSDAFGISLVTSREIAFVLSHLGVAGLVVGHQYLTRRTARSATLACSGLLAVGLFTVIWSWDFVASAQRLDRRLVDPEQLTLRIEEGSLRFFRRVRSQPLKQSMVLNGNIDLKGLPTGVLAVPEQVVSQVSFGSTEETFSSRHGHPYANEGDGFWWRFNHPPRLHEERANILSAALGGVDFLDGGRRPILEYLPELLYIDEKSYDLHGGTQSDLTVKVGFLVQRNDIATFPLEHGARYDRGSDHVEILRVTTNKNSLRIELKESRHRLIQDRIKSRWYLLRNRVKRQAVLSEGSLVYAILTPPMAPLSFPMLGISHSSLYFSLPSTDPPVDTDWFEDAELVRIETRNLGRFSKTIRMENLVLSAIPGP